MNKPIYIKVIQYCLVALFTLIVGSAVVLIVPPILGIFMNVYEDKDKMIINIITSSLVFVFFFVPYSFVFLRSNRSSIELSISKNDLDIKEFFKIHMKANAITDILIYVILGLPIMIYLLNGGILNEMNSSIAAVFIVIISPHLLFFYRLIELPIVSYLLSILLFCIGYIVCLILVYYRMIKRANSKTE